MNRARLVECSPRDEDSMSRLGAAQLVQRLLCREPGLRIVRRDLAAEPPSLVDRAFTEAMHIPAASQNDEQRRALRQSERLIAELEMASLLVIATPMHNFTVPALLKAWIDQVARVGRTFQTTSVGKIGQFADRPTYILASSGGFVTGERARQPDPGPLYACGFGDHRNSVHALSSSGSHQAGCRLVCAHSSLDGHAPSLDRERRLTLLPRSDRARTSEHPIVLMMLTTCADREYGRPGRPSTCRPRWVVFCRSACGSGCAESDMRLKARHHARGSSTAAIASAEHRDHWPKRGGSPRLAQPPLP
jgi:FMN-dependent NADH-azoreductase